ncbi:MAG: AAA family ATPase [Thermoplasmata archaeon]|nr:AAA family ATPase [Thermoplasmata archaeon]
MIERVVAIGGPPGSGKSTAGRRVVGALGLTFYSAGEEFRAGAKARGMDVEEFGRYAESHPEVDRTLDDRMQALARPGVLLDGRLQGVLCRRRGIPVYSIVVTATEAERARRVAERDHQPLAEALRRIRERTASERQRYRDLYGIDIDADPGDFSVDSTSLTPEAVAAEILKFLPARPVEGKS